MNASKYVTPLTISLAGIFAIVLVVVLVYFLLIKGTYQQYGVEMGIYHQYVAYESPLMLQQANAGVVSATVAKQTVADEWNQIQMTKNPNIDYSNVMNAWSQYINELNFKLGPSIDQWMPSTGIKPTAPITTPAPPADPNAVVKANPIVIPLNGGSPIVVVGSFRQILHHVAAWNNFNRIVLIDKLTLVGISPWVAGAYTATVYEFPKNGTTPGTLFPTGTGATGAGGGIGGSMGSAGRMPPMGNMASRTPGRP